MYRKWPSLSPTIFPGPLAAVSLLVASVWFPLCLPVAAALPLALYPKTVRGAVLHRRIRYLADAYVQLLQEAVHIWGYVGGLWRYRHLRPERSATSRLSQTTTASDQSRVGSIQPGGRT